MQANFILERKSSAVTLSDMEVFIFPELIYSLVLANIMSPRIWKWLEDPWFNGIMKMNPRNRIQRIKQYIMDHYVFNLDLSTWGLTQKDKEIKRFNQFIDEKILSQSNALFGYEGDKYYFDINIRTHFGLDAYDGDTIPYWKTETVEAMDAFQNKPNYQTGAGECVSLATLYAAALFIVGKIPLEKIYLMATPLHSQNFIDLGDGIITNNRRLVTKNMWFNGTPISNKARRALENEKVTLIAHESGCIHTIYPQASIDPTTYQHFQQQLQKYLTINLTNEILVNFLRQNHNFQHCFQLKTEIHGVAYFIGLEQLFKYEHGSPYLISNHTRDKLLNEIGCDEFNLSPLKQRILLNDVEGFVKHQQINLNRPADVQKLKQQLEFSCCISTEMIDQLINFCHLKPRLPETDRKKFQSTQEPLNIDCEMTREEIIQRLEHLQSTNLYAELSFYAFRDFSRIDSKPFQIAAFERNPVSIQALQDLTADQIYQKIQTIASVSIYDEPFRLAQPDEVWNFQTGDGLEKAILFANVCHAQYPDTPLRLIIEEKSATIILKQQKYFFAKQKQIPNAEWNI